MLNSGIMAAIIGGEELLVMGQQNGRKGIELESAYILGVTGVAGVSSLEARAMGGRETSQRPRSLEKNLGIRYKPRPQAGA